MVNHVSVSQKVDILSAMCEERLPDYPHLKEYKDVISEARAAITSRNKYVYNSMLFDPTVGKCVLGNASARGKLKVNMEWIGLEDIHEASIKIRRVMVRLHNLVLKTNHPLPN